MNLTEEEKDRIIDVLQQARKLIQKQQARTIDSALGEVLVRQSDWQLTRDYVAWKNEENSLNQINHMIEELSQ